MSQAWTHASVAVSTRDDTTYAVRLEGFFRPTWMSGLCSGLAERGVSIERVEATSRDGCWRADLTIVPPSGLDARRIPYAQLVEQTPEVEPGAFETKRFRLSESGEHGGTLELELHAADSIGLLGRVLGMLAMLSMFPVSLQIETRAGDAHDRFWLSGVGRGAPTRQSRETLERMLTGTSVEARSRPSESASRFSETNWGTPLDAAAELRAIPGDAEIAGMFPEALVEAARSRKLTLPRARASYVLFEFYPLREHAELLLQAAQLFYPDKPVRAALRTLGRFAPDALLSSTLGRVTLGTAQTVHGAVAAMCRTYAMNVRPSHAEVVEKAARSALVRLRALPLFIDSHHVGVFEGVLQFAGVRGTVRVRSTSLSEAELLCSW